MRAILLALILVVIAITHLSAIDNVVIKRSHYNLSTKQGLSDNWVTCIAQDQIGRIWVGTRHGLNCFDGEHLRTYNAAEHGLADNEVVNIQLTPDERLLIETRFGLSAYDPVSDQFKSIYQIARTDCYNSHLLAKIDQQGNYWINHCDTLIKLGKDTVKFHLPLALTYDSVRYKPILSMELDNKQHLWMMVQDQLVRFNVNTHHFQVLLDYDSLAISKYDGLHDLALTPEGDIWCGTSGGAIFRYRPATGEVKNYPFEQAGTASLLNVHQVIAAQDQLLFTINNLGLGRYDHQLDSVVLVNHPVFNLPGNKKLVSAFVDRTGGIWTGHERIGVNYLKDARLMQVLNATSGHGMRIDFVSAVVHDANGTMWVGTDGDGLYYQRHPGALLKKYEPIQAGTIMSLYADQRNKVWVGTYRQGLKTIDLSTMQLVVPKMQDKALLAQYDIRKITQDGQGAFWLANHAHGLTRYDPFSGAVQHWSTTTVPAMAGDWTFDVLVEGDTVWATSNNGVSKLNTRDNTCVNYFSDGREITGIEGHVYFISRTPTGKLWCGSSTGLYAFDGPTNGFVRILSSNGIPLRSIGFTNNEAVIGSENGLFIGDVSGQKWQYLTRDNGLPGNGFNERVCEYYNGRVYLGSNSGLVIFGTGAVQDYQMNAPLTVLRSEVNNKYVASDQLKNLPHSQNNVAFWFSALDYENMGFQRYEYRLAGHEDQWVSGNTGYAAYSDLNPGNYQFEVRAAGTSAPAVILPLVISHPFYRANWAYLIYVLVLITAAWLLVRQFLLKQAVKLEQARAEESEKANRWKTQFFQHISHDIRTPLTLIKGPVEQLQQSAQSDHQRGLLGLISKNVEHLSALVHEILELKSDHQEPGLHKQYVQPFDLIQATVEQYRHAFEAKSIDLNIVQQHQILVLMDDKRMSKVINNLLTNALKFTPELGQVTIKLGADDPRFDPGYVIHFDNSGQGFSLSALDHINDQQSQPFTESETGYGLGMEIVKNIMAEHQGKLLADNTADGARIALWFPLEQQSAQNKTQQLGKSVLVVEDNEELNAYLKQVLENHFAVWTALNGQQGLELAKRHQPDFIISDVMMPGMDGLALCQALKNSLETSHIPLLLLTAKGGSDDQLAGLLAGADDYMVKPFSPELLLQKVINRLQTIDQLAERKATAEHVSELSLPPGPDEQFIADLNQLIDTSYHQQQLSVEMMAQQLLLSRGGLYKKCMTLMGKSPMDLLQDKRISVASELLRTSKLSVSEIAYKVGYTSPGYFSKRFKSATGHKPSDFQVGNS